MRRRFAVEDCGLGINEDDSSRRDQLVPSRSRSWLVPRAERKPKQNGTMLMKKKAKATCRKTLLRKLMFYYRKSKIRKSEKGRPRGLPSSGMAVAERETLKRFGRGWMGPGHFPFIVLALIVCFSPFSLCYPSKNRVGQEVARNEVILDYSELVTNRERATLFSESDSIVYNGSRNSFQTEEETLRRDLTNWSAGDGVGGDGGVGAGGSKAANLTTRTHRKRHVRERSKRKPLLVTDEVQDYLMTFGYLPPSDRETGLLRTDEQLRSAIRNLQNFANIPVTGELDDKTLELLKKPRCGLPDFPYPTSKRKKRYTLHGQKWMHTNLTWSLRTLYPQNLDGGRVRSVLYHALDVWARHSRLTFQELNSDKADILIYFHSGYHGDGYAFDGRGQVLAHAFFPGKERGGDAHFDEDEIWILDPYADLEQIEGTSLFAVAAHEFGHSLGLSHSSVQGALMFPWYQGYEGLTPDLQLPDDDKKAIQQLYGAKDTKLWAKIPAYHPHIPRPYPPRPLPPKPRPPKPEPPRPTRPARPPTTPAPRPTYPPQKPPPYVPPRHPESTPDKPDTCNTSYDAISVIRHEVFIFKDKYLWRIGDHGLRGEYPVEITRLWYGLPKNLTKVDAVYERNDKKIVFFIGRMYYVFDANYLMAGYPKPLHHLGLPRELDHIDGAMVWGHNGKTFFFSGTMYWRFDDEVGRVELDYPRDMTMWNGVGYNIDAVFQWKDGNTYFFKGKGFWKFNDLRMRVENEKQIPSAPFWMGCPRKSDGDPPEPRRPIKKAKLISSASPMISNLHCLVIIIAATIYSIIA